jgi:gliding motility-associated-like protein
VSRLLFLCLGILFCVHLNGQVRERFYGDSILNEVILDSKILLNNGTINVGSISSPANIASNDCFIFQSDSNGIVLWSKKISTPNDDRFQEVIQTVDGNFVVIGYANATSVYNNNSAIIYKFDQLGNVIWQQDFKNTPAGEQFLDVAEINAGADLLVVGAYNYTPGLADGLAMSLNSNTGAVNWSKNYDISSTNAFANLVVINNEAYISGYLIVSNSFTDGTITKMNVNTGAIIWARSYGTVSNFTGFTSNYFGSLAVSSSNTLLITDQIGNDYTVTLGTVSHTLELDTVGNVLNSIELRAPNYNYTNDVSLCENNGFYFLTFHPSSIYGTQTQNLGNTATSARIVALNSLNGQVSSVRKVKKPVNSGFQAIIKTSFSGNKFVGVGTSYGNLNTQIGYRDAFKIVTDTTFNSIGGCIIQDTIVSIAAPAVTVGTFTYPIIMNIAWPSNLLVLANTVPLTLSQNACLLDTVIANFNHNNGPCLIDSVAFTDFSTSLLNKIVSWQWNFGDPGSGVSNTSFLKNPKHKFTSVGTYNVTLIATSNLGLSDTFVSLINYNPSNIFANAGADKILCNGNSINILGSTNGLTFNWLPTNNLSNSTILNPICTATTTTTYSLIATNSLGCSDTDEVLITVDNIPNITLTKSNDIACDLNQSQLEAKGASSYVWTPTATLNNSVIFNPIATPFVTTTYTVLATSIVCEAIDSITVLVANNNASGIVVPNAFSPNGDGLNDCLKVISNAIFTEFDFKVFNRFGNQVYSSQNADACWYGDFGPADCEVGTYFYYLNAKTDCSEVHRKGDITIVR